MPTDLLWHRIQFAFSVTYHYLFPQLTMGLALLIVVLTAANTASASYALQVGLVWWIIGITLAAGYFVNLFRSVRGKVDSPPSEHDS